MEGDTSKKPAENPDSEQLSNSGDNASKLSHQFSEATDAVTEAGVDNLDEGEDWPGQRLAQSLFADDPDWENRQSHYITDPIATLLKLLPCDIDTLVESIEIKEGGAEIFYFTRKTLEQHGFSDPQIEEFQSKLKTKIVQHLRDHCNHLRKNPSQSQLPEVIAYALGLNERSSESDFVMGDCYTNLPGAVLIARSQGKCRDIKIKRSALMQAGSQGLLYWPIHWEVSDNVTATDMEKSLRLFSNGFFWCCMARDEEIRKFMSEKVRKNKPLLTAWAKANENALTSSEELLESIDWFFGEKIPEEILAHMPDLNGDLELKLVSELFYEDTVEVDRIAAAISNVKGYAADLIRYWYENPRGQDGLDLSPVLEGHELHPDAPFALGIVLRMNDIPGEDADGIIEDFGGLMYGRAVEKMGPSPEKIASALPNKYPWLLQGSMGETQFQRISHMCSKFQKPIAQGKRDWSLFWLHPPVDPGGSFPATPESFRSCNIGIYYAYAGRNKYMKRVIREGLCSRGRRFIYSWAKHMQSSLVEGSATRDALDWIFEGQIPPEISNHFPAVEQPENEGFTVGALASYMLVEPYLSQVKSDLDVTASCVTRVAERYTTGGMPAVNEFIDRLPNVDAGIIWILDPEELIEAGLEESDALECCRLLHQQGAGVWSVKRQADLFRITGIKRIQKRYAEGSKGQLIANTSLLGNESTIEAFEQGEASSLQNIGDGIPQMQKFVEEGDDWSLPWLLPRQCPWPESEAIIEKINAGILYTLICSQILVKQGMRDLFRARSESMVYWALMMQEHLVDGSPLRQAVDDFFDGDIPREISDQFPPAEQADEDNFYSVEFFAELERVAHGPTWHDTFLKNVEKSTKILATQKGKPLREIAEFCCERVVVQPHFGLLNNGYTQAEVMEFIEIWSIVRLERFKEDFANFGKTKKDRSMIAIADYAIPTVLWAAREGTDFLAMPKHLAEFQGCPNGMDIQGAWFLADKIKIAFSEEDNLVIKGMCLAFENQDEHCRAFILERMMHPNQTDLLRDTAKHYAEKIRTSEELRIMFNWFFAGNVPECFTQYYPEKPAPGVPELELAKILSTTDRTTLEGMHKENIKQAAEFAALYKRYLATGPTGTFREYVTAHKPKGQELFLNIGMPEVILTYVGIPKSQHLEFRRACAEVMIKDSESHRFSFLAAAAEVIRGGEDIPVHEFSEILDSIMQICQVVGFGAEVLGIQDQRLDDLLLVIDHLTSKHSETFKITLPKSSVSLLFVFKLIEAGFPIGPGVAFEFIGGVIHYFYCSRCEPARKKVCDVLSRPEHRDILEYWAKRLKKEIAPADSPIRPALDWIFAGEIPTAILRHYPAGEVEIAPEPSFKFVESEFRNAVKTGGEVTMYCENLDPKRRYHLSMGVQGQGTDSAVHGPVFKSNESGSVEATCGINNPNLHLPAETGSYTYVIILSGEGGPIYQTVEIEVVREYHPECKVSEDAKDKIQGGESFVVEVSDLDPAKSYSLSLTDGDTMEEIDSVGAGEHDLNKDKAFGPITTPGIHTFTVRLSEDMKTQKEIPIKIEIPFPEAPALDKDNLMQGLLDDEAFSHNGDPEPLPIPFTNIPAEAETLVITNDIMGSVSLSFNDDGEVMLDMHDLKVPQQPNQVELECHYEGEGVKSPSSTITLDLSRRKEIETGLIAPKFDPEPLVVALRDNVPGYSIFPQNIPENVHLVVSGAHMEDPVEVELKFNTRFDLDLSLIRPDTDGPHTLIFAFRNKAGQIGPETAVDFHIGEIPTEPVETGAAGGDNPDPAPEEESENLWESVLTPVFEASALATHRESILENSSYDREGQSVTLQFPAEIADQLPEPKQIEISLFENEQIDATGDFVIEPLGCETFQAQIIDLGNEVIVNQIREESEQEVKNLFAAALGDGESFDFTRGINVENYTEGMSQSDRWPWRQYAKGRWKQAMHLYAPIMSAILEVDSSEQMSVGFSPDEDQHRLETALLMARCRGIEFSMTLTFTDQSVTPEIELTENQTLSENQRVGFEAYKVGLLYALCKVSREAISAELMMKELDEQRDKEKKTPQYYNRIAEFLNVRMDDEERIIERRVPGKTPGIRVVEQTTLKEERARAEQVDAIAEKILRDDAVTPEERKLYKDFLTSRLSVRTHEIRTSDKMTFDGSNYNRVLEDPGKAQIVVDRFCTTFGLPGTRTREKFKTKPEKRKNEEGKMETVQIATKALAATRHYFINSAQFKRFISPDFLAQLNTEALDGVYSSALDQVRLKEKVLATLNCPEPESTEDGFKGEQKNRFEAFLLKQDFYQEMLKPDGAFMTGLIQYMKKAEAPVTYVDDLAIAPADLFVEEKLLAKMKRPDDDKDDPGGPYLKYTVPGLELATA